MSLIHRMIVYIDSMCIYTIHTTYGLYYIINNMFYIMYIVYMICLIYNHGSAGPAGTLRVNNSALPWRNKANLKDK